MAVVGPCPCPCLSVCLSVCRQVDVHHEVFPVEVTKGAWYVPAHHY